jgi:hypothetical protein
MKQPRENPNLWIFRSAESKLQPMVIRYFREQEHEVKSDFGSRTARRLTAQA